RGIFTTDIRKKNIEIILQTIKNNNDSNYVFGNSSHIFNYLLHKPLKYDTFLQELTENKIHTFMESNSKSCIYIDGYPNNKIEEGKYLLQDSLEEKNYKVFIFDNYVTIEKIF